MRVVLVNRYFHPDESATSRMVSSLAFGLAEHGFQVEVLTSRQRHDERATVLRRHEILQGVRIHRLPATRFGRSGLAGRAADYASFQAAAALWSLANLRRDDVVIACTDPPLISVSLALAAAARGARLISWLHDIFPEVAVELGVLKRGGAASRLTIALRDWSLRRAEVNIVPTAGMVDGLCRRGLPGEMLLTIPYWSDDEIEPVPPGDNQLRAGWGLRDTFVVGYSGNFGRSHEFDTLIEAATLLRDASCIRFLLIGGGFGLGHVRAEIERRGLANIMLQPLQPRARLAESLSAPDLHLISLRPELEPYVVPSKLYGIMAAGRPAIFIGSEAGVVATSLCQHGSGETVAIGAARELADRIVALRDDAPRRTQMGVHARIAFATRHRRIHAVEAWADVLASLDKRQEHAPKQADMRLFGRPR